MRTKPFSKVHFALLSIFCVLLQQSAVVLAVSGSVRAQDAVTSDEYLGTAGKRPTLPDHTARIKDLLSLMTLEEKVGQMTQLQLGMIAEGQDSEIRIDEEKLEKAIVKYGVGSILNVSNHALPVERWHEIIGAIQRAAGRTRLKIPVIYGIDSIHGANYVREATLFPQQIGMAATWNPQLMQDAAEITAMETRAAGIPWSFSPVLDVGRQPLWPRFWETFGEDPYLASVMGVAFVRGLEGRDVSSGKHVASSLKHYVGYSFPLNGRDRTPAWIPENYMREYFLPPFEAAVDAGARTIMVNSAEVNGVPGHVNKHLLTEVLRDEYGFDGFVVSDWEDIKKLVTFWKIAKDEKEATRRSVMAGIDMSMVPSDYSFADVLIELVKEGRVPMWRIDEAVARILRVKFELGLFENPGPDSSLVENFGKAEYARAALDAAHESVILAKNADNALPLAKNRKVLVTGPTADSLISLNNGWTWVWQGSEPSLYKQEKNTVREAIEKKIGASNVTYVPGTEIVRDTNIPSNVSPTMIDREIDIPASVAAARNSDVVVLCLGEGSYTETPGNITDLTLPEPQLKLAEALIATGRPVIAVMIQGRPRIISRFAENVAAILVAMNPGDEGGDAIADVLFGDYNPDGKFPFTYPRTPNSHLNYDHKLFEVEETPFGNSPFEPQFQFGHGLSYTTFEYSGLTLSRSDISKSYGLDVSVTVRNTGSRQGKETVILYVRDVVASLSPAGKRVKRFAKVNLRPGESKTVKFSIEPEDLSFFGTDGKPVIEPGEFLVLVGGLEKSFTLK
ncbi:MAG TPA: glycoside hydrolase family 3 N-terminal domain-containing protein [Aridibacter sp.]|nr:glycoside hydrolase family 3 N-terminal domain-containing protein [Aridibacter sp.]